MVPAASVRAALLLARLLHTAAVRPLPVAQSQGRGELGAESKRRGISALSDLWGSMEGSGVE